MMQMRLSKSDNRKMKIQMQLLVITASTFACTAHFDIKKKNKNGKLQF
jgi:hypothetical protein